MYRLIAAIQMRSNDCIADNLSVAQQLICEAAEHGARVVILPENFAYFGFDNNILSVSERLGDGKIQTFLKNQAITNNIYIVGGTIPITSKSDPQRIKSTSIVFDNNGVQVVKYEKIHLFDVYVEETKEYFHESFYISSGNEVVVFDSPLGRIGLAICYDIRFPELFRKMISMGVKIIAIPAAFTAQTGGKHWEVLLRSRAIENQCYVVAANQAGIHDNKKKTYGNSMIIDPDGAIKIQNNGEDIGVIVSEINNIMQDNLRNAFPVLDHIVF